MIHRIHHNVANFDLPDRVLQNIPIFFFPTVLAVGNSLSNEKKMIIYTNAFWSTTFIILCLPSYDSICWWKKTSSYNKSYTSCTNRGWLEKLVDGYWSKPHNIIVFDLSITVLSSSLSLTKVHKSNKLTARRNWKTAHHTEFMKRCTVVSVLGKCPQVWCPSTCR